MKVLHSPIIDDYACGWVEKTSKKLAKGAKVLFHSGGNPMWASMSYLIPEKKVAFLFAVNECGSKITAEAFNILNREVFPKFLDCKEYHCATF